MLDGAVAITVERCAECNGAMRVICTTGDRSAIRAAARQRRYLAEAVETAANVNQDERGHRVSCSMWTAKEANG